MANATENIKNASLFRDMEYVFSKYYNENIAPVVSHQKQVLRQNQERETRERSDSGWGGFIDAASPFATTQVARETGAWNKKSVDDLINMIDQSLSKKQGLKEDIKVLMDAWEIAAKKELGEENYNRLSSECPSKSLAYEFVNSRIDSLMMEQLAKSKIPSSSLEYIMKKSFRGSLIGKTLDYLQPRIRQNTDTEDKLRKLSEKLYNPSASAKLTAALGSSAVDLLTTGGTGSVIKTGSFLALDVGGNYLSFSDDEDCLDVQLGKAIFDNEDAWSQFRSDAKKVKPSASVLIDLVNKNLSHKMKVPAYRPPYNNEEEALMRKQLLDAAKGDAATHLSNVFKSLQSEGVTVKSASAVPAWMMQKTPEEALRYSATFTAMAIEMKRTGKTVMKIGKTNMSFAEVAQRGYDYARAADQMQKQAKKPQMQAASVAVSSQQASAQEQEQRQYQQQVQQQQYAMQQQYQQGQPMPLQMQQSAVNYQTEGMDGWHGLMKQFGLSGIGDIGHNLGYVIAMLPDMLVGMLTGKSSSLRLKDNLLPFGAIFAGMFVKNPFLKMLLIGLGGANILNKAGHNLLENAGVQTSQQRPKQYVQHADELLSERIEQPAMKGNALLATIDHKPCVIYIDEQSADAYYQGKLPLNVLCNAVLRKYDEQQAAVRESYDRGVTQGQEQQRTMGIK